MSCYILTEKKFSALRIYIFQEYNINNMHQGSDPEEIQMPKKGTTKGHYQEIHAPPRTF
jgi:hypothetical protein